MRLTTEQERKFFDAVRNGAAVTCSQDVYDAIKAHGYVLDDIQVSKYLNAGEIVAVDRRLLLPPAIPWTEFAEQTFTARYDEPAEPDKVGSRLGRF